MRGGAWLVGGLFGCYSPAVPTGAPCDIDHPCPAGQSCVGGTCGGTSIDRDADPDVPAEAALPVLCDPADANLVGCWDFEGDVIDRSAYTNPTTPTGVAFVPGKVGLGAAVDATSLIAIPDSVALNVQRLTLEVWLYPTALPGPTARFGILDNDGQYGAFLHPAELRCTANPAMLSAPMIAPNRWTHVACSYDGSMVRAFLDGLEVASTASSGSIGTGSTNGMTIGSNSPSGDSFVGVLDQLRIYRVARTPAQICAAAGASGCP
jgi:hypothetical protein